MNEPEGALRAIHGKSDHTRDDLIHFRCAKAAPNGHNERFVLRNAERAARGALIRTHEAKPYGRSGYDDLFGVLIILPRLGKADHDLIHALFQLARCETGLGVALVDERGDTKLRRLMKHRIADISAGADDDVRLELLDDPPARGSGFDKVRDKLDIVLNALGRERPAQIAYRHAADLVPFAGDKLHFHFAECADE